MSDDSPAAEPGAGRCFLFVSAPFGPFGRELAASLRRRGARVLRVLLNGGDAADWGLAHALPYFGDPAGWTAWLERALAANGVTDLVAYGDLSPQAARALELAEARGIRRHVLEQGYFRPDWVTLEPSGVNANSRLPRDPNWYREHPAATRVSPAQAVGRSMPSAVVHIVAHHIAMQLGAPIFPRYRPHYAEPALKQAIGHTVRFLLQQTSKAKRRGEFERAVATSGPVFLCALQRPGDSQLWRHSDFKTKASFIEHVVASFAANAAPDARLIVRPHPLDPGLVLHADCLARAARQRNVEDRVAYVDYGKLHEVLPHVDGVICVNSTAGLAAIEFGKPTITLGKAIYDIRGLTHQGPLASFWTSPQPPDADLYLAFRRVVLALTQVNGAFATREGRRLAVQAVAGRVLAPADAAPAIRSRPEADRRPLQSASPIGEIGEPIRAFG